MAMTRIRVTDMHGYTLKELAKLANNAKKPYTRRVLTAVVMTLQGIGSDVVAQTLGCSHASVCNYINWWNERGMEAAKDRRGTTNKSSITDEMLKDIDDAIRNRKPSDHGYHSKNRWDTRVLQRYILDTYGKKYSTEWIRQILHRLGFTFKRGTKRPTKANKEAQEGFKKNDRLVGRTCA